MPTKLGQNFLKDQAAVKRIVESANLTPNDVVLEVGPGRGILTESLAKNAGKVIAIELDRELIPFLKKKFENIPNVEIIEGDILKINLPKLIKELLGSEMRYKVVANIPYYITAPIIRLLLETKCPPAEMILMVQKEVAERICAPTGKLSVLAISVQYYATPKILFSVSRKSFDPAPEVDSAVIHVSHSAERESRNQEETKYFFRIVRAGFSARRKTLANSLANSFRLSKDATADQIQKLGLNPSVRAQELSLDNWKQLAKNLSLSQQ